MAELAGGDRRHYYPRPMAALFIPPNFPPEEEAKMKIGFSWRRAAVATLFYAVVASAAYWLWAEPLLFWLALPFALVGGITGLEEAFVVWMRR